MSRTTRWTTAALCASVAMMIALVVGCGGSKKDSTVQEVVKEEKGMTLVLVNPTTGAALSCTLSKGQKKDEDHVRWFNQTTGPVTIAFSPKSPFLETELSFVVQPNEFSPYYTLNKKLVNGADNGPYIYSTTPRLIPTPEGPGEPTITVGD